MVHCVSFLDCHNGLSDAGELEEVAEDCKLRTIGEMFFEMFQRIQDALPRSGSSYVRIRLRVSGFSVFTTFLGRGKLPTGPFKKRDAISNRHCKVGSLILSEDGEIHTNNAA